ncbi:double zinc ribbon domain-containing protein [Clostridium sp. DL1XJH146]
MSLIFMLLIGVLILSLIIAIGVFVYRDSQEHNMDPVVWTLIAVLVPNLIGFIIYLVVRSNKNDTLRCPSCHQPIDIDYVKCPHCGAKLKGTCSNCGKPINPEWNSCPYCSHDIDKETINLNKENSNITDNYEQNNTFTYSEGDYSKADNKNKNKKGLKIIIGIFIALIVLIFITVIVSFAGFNTMTSTSVSNVSVMETSSETPVIVNEILGKGSKSTMKSKYHYWNGTKQKKVDVEAGETVEIEYSSIVEDGELEIKLYSSVVNMSLPTNEEGKYSYTADKDEELVIEIIGNRTKGEYSIETEIVE